MPKLDAEAAARVVKQGTVLPSPLPLLPPGTYVGTLRQVVEQRTDYSPPWLEWRFETRDRVLSFYTSLRDEPWALWKLKQTFAAFGVSPQTDTDALAGRPMRLVVSQRPNSYHGGEIENRVDRLLPPEVSP